MANRDLSVTAAPDELGAAMVRAPRASLRDRVMAARDRLLASPRFHRWAARFPLTRPVARRQARALFDLCAGFVYAQVLTACVQLKLFEILAGGPRTAAELGRDLGLDADAAGRLLEAATALRLVERRGHGRYGLGMLGAASLGSPGIAAMVGHHSHFYADLADPVALLRGERATALSGYWAYASTERPSDLGAGQVSAYTGLMSASQSFVADAVLDAYPFRQHRGLLDVAGGDGTFAARAAGRVPGLAVVTFDLPAVAALADARFDAAGLASRARAVGGDMQRDALPTGCDVVTLIRVLHDHGDDVAMALLRSCRAALPPGGTLVIAEPMSGIAGSQPMSDAYLALYLLAMGSGRVRPASALMAMAEKAGFADAASVATSDPLITSIVVAKVR